MKLEIADIPNGTGAGARGKWTPIWAQLLALAPGKAVKAARVYLQRLVRNADQWQTERICLEPAGTGGKWIYLIEVVPPLPAGGLEGKVVPSKIVVLMDGTVLEATAK